VSVSKSTNSLPLGVCQLGSEGEHSYQVLNWQQEIFDGVGRVDPELGDRVVGVGRHQLSLLLDYGRVLVPVLSVHEFADLFV